MRKQTTKKGKGRKVPIEPPIKAPHVQRQFNFGPEFALSEEDEALAASDDPKHREAIRLRWLNKEKVTMKMIEVALYDCSDPKFETMVGDLNPEERQLRCWPQSRLLEPATTFRWPISSYSATGVGLLVWSHKQYGAHSEQRDSVR